MEIKVSTENGRVPVTVLHVDGNIDSASYQNFQSTAKALIDQGARYILIDLSHASFVSSNFKSRATELDSAALGRTRSRVPQTVTMKKANDTPPTNTDAHCQPR